MRRPGNRVLIGVGSRHGPHDPPLDPLVEKIDMVGGGQRSPLGQVFAPRPPRRRFHPFDVPEQLIPCGLPSQPKVFRPTSAHEEVDSPWMLRVGQGASLNLCAISVGVAATMLSCFCNAFGRPRQKSKIPRLLQMCSPMCSKS